MSAVVEKLRSDLARDLADLQDEGRMGAAVALSAQTREHCNARRWLGSQK